MPDTDPGLAPSSPLAAAAAAASAATGGRVPSWVYLAAVSVLGALAAAGGGAGSFVVTSASPAADMLHQLDDHEDEGHPTMEVRIEAIEKAQADHAEMLQQLRDNQVAICTAVDADCVR